MANLKLPKHKDANIWLDNKGVWRFDVQLKRSNGTEFRRNGIASDKKDARTKRDQAFTEFNADQGRSQAAKGHTLAQWGSYCIEHVYPQELSDRALESYTDNLRVHIAPLLGDTLLRDVSVQQLQMFFNDLTKSTLGRASVVKVRTVLSSIMRRAQEQALIDINPVRLVKIKADRKGSTDDNLLADKRILTPAEGDRLLDVSSGTYIHAAVLIALKMGLRSGECLGLTWSAIDFEGNTLMVKQQVQRIKGKGLVTSPPKSRAGVRRLPMPPSVTEFLKEEKQRTDSIFVVSNGQGKPLEPSRLRGVFDDCAAVAGLWGCQDTHGNPLPEPTFHDLRSTFISHMANVVNVPLSTLMKLAGHANVEITLQFYARASEIDLREAMANVS